ncbi:MAG: flagellar brake protein [Gammaproteobacteria bacterium]|nr:flagellar brake protein [Gammaproteobacteria bacterium]
MMHRTNPYKSLADSEQITDPAKILRLLKRFTKRYTPLTVQIPNPKEHYTSCIVGIDGKYILLDELLPSPGNELLVTERALLVTGKIDGIVIQLFTTLKRVDDKDKILTYYMKLPSLLEYQQRRQTYRASIPITRELPVIIENNHGILLKGELRNLSHGGAGMILLADKTIMENGRLYECTIELPDGMQIYCTAELCFTKNIASRNKQYIGVQFVELLPMQSRLIGRCISELERELIRKR